MLMVAALCGMYCNHAFAQRKEENNHLSPEAKRQQAQQREILISNPGELVSPEYINDDGTDRWRTLTYKTEKFSGVMIAEGGGANIPAVTVPLKIKGKYRIYLGMFSGYYTLPEIKARLKDEKQAQILSIRETCKDNVFEIGQNIYEIFWKEADLNGQDLIIESNNDPSILPVALAFIRLESIANFARKPALINPPMVITSDGWGAFGGFEHVRPEDLFRQFEKIPKKNKIKMLIWGNGVGDWCNYPTHVGSYFSTPHDMLKSGELPLQQKNIRTWQERGWNSLQLMRDYTRERGWEFQVYIRMQGFGVLYPRGIQVQSAFFNEHPQYHCLDRDGQRLSRLSYAYPEVQEHMLNLIKEISSYQPDGICLNFVRGLPLVLYEPVMVGGFRKKYGVDPRKLSETDPKWLDYQAEITTEFVKMAKASLRQGQRLSAMVPGTMQDCRKYGLDPQAWLIGGLIEDLIPTGTTYDKRDVHRDTPDSLDFQNFNRLEGRDRIRLMPMLYPWGKFQADFAGWLRIYDRCLEMGADALAVWDADIEDRYKKAEWVGDIAKFKEINRYDFKRIQLNTLQGFRVDRYHYFEGI
jgi:hypothetical protein